MVRKVIRHDKVTREQYDKLQVDAVNKIEELEIEIEKLQEKQKTLSILWGMLAFMTIVSVLLLAASIRNIYPLL